MMVLQPPFGLNDGLVIKLLVRPSQGFIPSPLKRRGLLEIWQRGWELDWSGISCGGGAFLVGRLI
jgi:hypothetical protein